MRDGKRYGPERDISSGDKFEQPAGPSARFSAPAAMHSDETFLVGGAGGKMFLLHTRDGRTLQKDEGDRDMNEVTAVVAGPGGQMASASSHAKNGRVVVRHWRNGMGGETHACELNTRVNHQAYLPDGSALLLACADGRVRIWDPASNEHRAELDCGAPVLAVAANGDGTQILAGCADGTAQFWNLQERKRLLVIRHRSEVRGVAFHGETLLTASADGSARRWDARTGLSLGPPLSHPDAISALATWNDLAATGGRGRYVRVWRIK